MRELLRQLFTATVDDLDVGRAMRIGAGDKLRAMARHALLVLAFGKAARPMAQALVDTLPGATLRGLVVPQQPDDAPLPPFEVIVGGHPLPTAGSMRAAARALELARSARPEETVVFLVSGGGSAMLELPADPGVTLGELRTLYQALVRSGADITSINVVRRRLSAVKDGRLALAAAAAHHHLTLAISDVPGEGHSALASGPTTSDQTTVAQCRTVLDRHDLWSAVPPTLRLRLELDDLPPPPSLRAIRSSEFSVVEAPHHARAFLQQRATAAGLFVVEDQSVDDWPYERAADHLLHHLDRVRRRHPGRTVAILTGGELSVPLPADLGIGGRNQQFALACARRIRGRPITILSAGTDGIDGNSPAAGAIVDGTTMQRARTLGLDVHDHLRRFDAFPLLTALGDTVITGPTGTNVRDLRLLVHTR